MITALRISRGILAFFIIWQVVTLTDILLGIMLNSASPLTGYTLGVIAFKFFATFFLAIFAMKARTYANALHAQNHPNTVLLKDWYSI